MRDLIVELLHFLHEHPLITSVRLISHDETPSGEMETKIRCRIKTEYHFQIWLHHEALCKDYAYQLFTDHPIIRWDNAPHFPDIKTAPHHFHNQDNSVGESPLNGEPLSDIKKVLSLIKDWLQSSSGSS